ncbi:hypothetical protein DPMN_109244 [Dreissena polymorpha]|uniref:LRAT domain-containing protein n=1 Tax=Dreissena polymorpha TaxID=45954 RepID=A0A9D4QLR8_DREPO|nr:hypothetical protein DPMN_109244 [Dreissena polymorpha]
MDEYAPYEIASALTLFVEGMLVIWDIGQVYERRQNAKILRSVLLKYMGQRLVKGAIASGLAIVGCRAGEKLATRAGVEIETGIFSPAAFVLSLIGGTAGVALGHMIGSVIGPYVGKMVLGWVKREDLAVKTVNELVLGDVIVMSPGSLHQRCYAVVTGTDPKENKVNVVRNTYKAGIVQEWIRFEQPTYKLVFKEDECYNGNAVVMRAQTKVGEHAYSFVKNNCRHFACWCKEKKV